MSLSRLEIFGIALCTVSIVLMYLSALIVAVEW